MRCSALRKQRTRLYPAACVSGIKPYIRWGTVERNAHKMVLEMTADVGLQKKGKGGPQPRDELRGSEAFDTHRRTTAFAREYSI